MVWLKSIWNKLTKPFVDWNDKRKMKKRIEELKKRDPFIYK